TLNVFAFSLFLQGAKACRISCGRDTVETQPKGKTRKHGSQRQHVSFKRLHYCVPGSVMFLLMYQIKL
ncbi:hypothetical protein Pfo_020193, partial [Paulownia fortunei]